MASPCVEVRLVGKVFRIGSPQLTERLCHWGFRCHFVDTLRVACQLLSLRRIDVVLGEARLPDGTGIRLLGALKGLHVTAFICFAGRRRLLLGARYGSGAGVLGIGGAPASGVYTGAREVSSGRERTLGHGLVREK